MKVIPKPLLIIVSAFIGLVLLTVGTFNIYKNNKTDFSGGGSLRVTKCYEQDWAWRLYRCEGTYHSGAGMVIVDNVEVSKVRGEYKADEWVGDVYPTSYSFSGVDFTPRTFVTGFERTGVLYNLPWILMAMAGLFLPAFAVMYTVLTRDLHKKDHKRL